MRFFGDMYLFTYLCRVMFAHMPYPTVLNIQLYYYDTLWSRFSEDSS